jgi:hypothetical protein
VSRGGGFGLGVMGIIWCVALESDFPGSSFGRFYVYTKGSLACIYVKKRICRQKYERSSL